MAINEWKIWQTLGIAKKPEPEKIDVEQDLKQIEDFLKQVNNVVSDIKKKITEFKKLRKQEHQLKAKKVSVKSNLESQIRLYDKILKSYEFFDLDEDISAIRVKKIAKALKKEAEEKKINAKLLHRIKTDEKWTYNW